MKEWFTIAELAEEQLPGFRKTRKAIEAIARREWMVDGFSRLTPSKTKPVWQFHIDLLPREARLALMVRHAGEDLKLSERQEKARKELWARFDSLPDKQKVIAQTRLDCLNYAEKLYRGGLTQKAANIAAAARFRFSQRSVFNWQNLIGGQCREDWLAALAPSYTVVKTERECHLEAWDVLVADYLRPSRPAFSACYRRMVEAATKNGWEPIPQERVLRRRMEREVPREVQILSRAGQEKAKALYPDQRRDRSQLHAMQAVNMDGHKLDVFVKVPWSDKPVRLYLIGIQDLYSGKLLSWRLSNAENWEIVRLVIGDMISNFGIPEKITLDNGRAFASKWISGGTKNRFRFKVKDDDPQGLLTTFGIETQWTTPYSGKSKPIERTWRDLAENIAKHPFCAGAYTGNKPEAKPEDYGTRAVDYEAFKAHVDEQILLHNARQGRTGGNCNGRSFDETFAESLAQDTTIVRTATEAQRALWLLASDAIRTKKNSGEIHFRGNRYWTKALNRVAGQKVTIRFDPDNLHQSIRVYDLDNRLITIADCIDKTGYYDEHAARLHTHARRDFDKGVKLQKEAIVKLSPERLAEIYGSGKTTAKPKVATPTPKRAKVTRLSHGNLAVKEQHDTMSEEEFELAFSRGINRVIKFPERD